MKVVEVNPLLFNKRVADELKKVKEITPPSWVKFVKSGADRARVPDQPDFWYRRCASLLRKLYRGEIIGVHRLQKLYGSAQRRYVRPRHKKRASGSIIRKALQQLELAGFVMKGKKGREITMKGRSFLERIAKEMKAG